MRRFVDVKNGIAFRIIFAHEKRKESLISFLNAVLPLEDKQKIVSVEILRPFRLPFLSPGNATIMDVKAKDKNNNTCLIEIQLGDMNGLSRRVVYYASKSDSSQTEKGDSPEKLSPIFFVGILCFKASRNKEYINCRRFTDILIEESREEAVEFIFIELPKFNKEPTELISLTD